MEKILGDRFLLIVSYNSLIAPEANTGQWTHLGERRNVCDLKWWSLAHVRAFSVVKLKSKTRYKSWKSSLKLDCSPCPEPGFFNFFALVSEDSNSITSPGFISGVYLDLLVYAPLRKGSNPRHVRKSNLATWVRHFRFRKNGFLSHSDGRYSWYGLNRNLTWFEKVKCVKEDANGVRI